MKTTRSPFATLLLLVLFIVGLALTWFNFNIALPHTLWFQAIRQPDINAIDQMLFHYSLLPRLTISLLVGAGLGLCPAYRRGRGLYRPYRRRPSRS